MSIPPFAALPRKDTIFARFAQECGACAHFLFWRQEVCSVTLNGFLMLNRLIPVALAACVFPVLAGAQPQFDNSTIPYFDLSRYLGTWYEIARFDHSFERGMDNVVAEYQLRDDGHVRVINSGWKGGKYKWAEGKAKQPDPKGNPANLKVSFFLFFYSPYRIMMLDDDYQVALVGSKSPKYLWILSRTPELSPEIIEVVLEEAQERGYDTSQLIWVDQTQNIDQARKDDQAMEPGLSENK
jgi:lipocalin